MWGAGGAAGEANTSGVCWLFDDFCVQVNVHEADPENLCALGSRDKTHLNANAPYYKDRHPRLQWHREPPTVPCRPFFRLARGTHRRHHQLAAKSVDVSERAAASTACSGP